ncbi:MAG: hypothetical protein HY013_18855 [Candidatus Solibacter usitatus]|nr:hypothetical protein [Candidatus Solibacter usitatus]
MRYWAYFAAKLAVAGAASGGLFALIRWIWPPQPHLLTQYPAVFGRDLGYTLAVGLWFLISCGLLYLCVWDQRYRCRVCLRRLRMPIEIGSWSRMMLLGRPRIEYICTWGHGKLNVEEVQISGAENPAWTPQADIWEELTGAGSKDDVS